MSDQSTEHDPAFCRAAAAALDALEAGDPIDTVDAALLLMVIGNHYADRYRADVLEPKAEERLAAKIALRDQLAAALGIDVLSDEAVHEVRPGFLSDQECRQLAIFVDWVEEGVNA